MANAEEETNGKTTIFKQQRRIEAKGHDMIANRSYQHRSLGKNIQKIDRMEELVLRLILELKELKKSLSLCS